MKVVHIMADGTVRESVTGLMIPAGNPAYRIIAAADRKDREHKKERESA